MLLEQHPERTATQGKEYHFILKKNNLAQTQTGLQRVDGGRKDNIYPQNLNQTNFILL